MLRIRLSAIAVQNNRVRDGHSSFSKLTQRTKRLARNNKTALAQAGADLFA
jgi:hypothetical protein